MSAPRGPFPSSHTGSLLRALSETRSQATEINAVRLLLGWNYLTRVNTADEDEDTSRAIPTPTLPLPQTGPADILPHELSRFVSIAAAAYTKTPTAFLRVASEGKNGVFLTKSDIVLFSPEKSSSDLLPAHALVLDRASRSIVLAIRGTTDYHDIIADLAGAAVPQLGGGAAHAGMASVAEALAGNHALKVLAPRAVVYVNTRRWAQRGQWATIPVGSLISTENNLNSENNRFTDTAAATISCETEVVTLFSPDELLKLRTSMTATSSSSGGSGIGVGVHTSEASQGPYLHCSGLIALIQRLVDWSSDGLLDLDDSSSLGAVSPSEIHLSPSPTCRHADPWRVLIVGHSLGAGIGSIFALKARNILIFPGYEVPSSLPSLVPQTLDTMANTVIVAPISTPVYALGYGVPAVLDSTLSAIGSLTEWECAKLRKYPMYNEFKGPLPKIAWSHSLPFISSVVIGDDIVPRLTVASVNALNKMMADPALYTAAKTHAANIMTARAQGLAAPAFRALAVAGRSAGAAAASVNAAVASVGLNTTNAERSASWSVAFGFGARAALMAASSTTGASVGAAAGAVTIAAVATHAALYGSDKTRAVLSFGAAKMVAVSTAARVAAGSAASTAAEAAGVAAAGVTAVGNRAGAVASAAAHAGVRVANNVLSVIQSPLSPVSPVPSRSDSDFTTAYDAVSELESLEIAAEAAVNHVSVEFEEEEEEATITTNTAVTTADYATCVDTATRSSLLIDMSNSINDGDLSAYLKYWRNANLATGQTLCVPGAVFYMPSSSGSGSGSSLATRVPASNFALVVPSQTALADHSVSGSYVASLHI